MSQQPGVGQREGLRNASAGSAPETNRTLREKDLRTRLEVVMAKMQVIEAEIKKLWAKLEKLWNKLFLQNAILSRIKKLDLEWSEFNIEKNIIEGALQAIQRLHPQD